MKKKASIAIMTALIAPVCLGFTAITVDVGNWYATLSSVSDQASAAAQDIAMAKLYYPGLTAQAEQTIAEQAVTDDGGITGETVTVTPGSNSVTVGLSSPALLELPGLGIRDHEIGRTASSQAVTTNSGTIIALSR